MSRMQRIILLAEDNPLDAELAVDALREATVGNPVVVVRDGVEALDWLRRKGLHAARAAADPAVILLDIRMPRMDGLDVLKEIREDEDLCRIPVVMLTSSREERDLSQSWELGVNAYVVKPVDVRQYFEAVQNIGYFWAVLNETTESQ